MQFFHLGRKARPGRYYQPKQCTIIGDMPQNHYTFAVFDPPQIGSLMTPAVGHAKSQGQLYQYF